MKEEVRSNKDSISLLYCYFQFNYDHFCSVFCSAWRSYRNTGCYIFSWMWFFKNMNGNHRTHNRCSQGKYLCPLPVGCKDRSVSFIIKNTAHPTAPNHLICLWNKFQNPISMTLETLQSCFMLYNSSHKTWDKCHLLFLCALKAALMSPAAKLSGSIIVSLSFTASALFKWVIDPWDSLGGLPWELK